MRNRSVHLARMKYRFARQIQIQNSTGLGVDGNLVAEALLFLGSELLVELRDTCMVDPVMTTV